MQAQKISIAMAKLQQNAPMGAKLTNIFAQKLVLGVFGVVMFCFFFFWSPFPSMVSLTSFFLSILLFTFALFPIPYRLPSVRHSITHLGINGQSKCVAFIPSNSKHDIYNVCILTYKKEKKVMQEANKLTRVGDTSEYKAAIVRHDVYVRTGNFDSITVWQDMPVNRVYLLFFILTIANTRDSIFNFSTVRRYAALVSSINIIALLPVVLLVLICKLITRYLLMLSNVDLPNPSPTLPEGAETAVNTELIPITSKKP
jgi:hypothetical protein